MVAGVKGAARPEEDVNDVAVAVLAVWGGCWWEEGMWEVIGCLHIEKEGYIWGVIDCFMCVHVCDVGEKEREKEAAQNRRESRWSVPICKPRGEEHTCRQTSY